MNEYHQIFKMIKTEYKIAYKKWCLWYQHKTHKCFESENWYEYVRYMYDFFQEYDIYVNILPAKDYRICTYEIRVEYPDTIDLIKSDETYTRLNAEKLVFNLAFKELQNKLSYDNNKLGKSS